MLVDGTNEYACDVIAEKERAGKVTPKSRWVKWRPVTTKEMKAVLAVIINMGVIHCPEQATYWKMSWESYIPFFHDVLPQTDLKKSSGCYINKKTQHQQDYDELTKLSLFSIYCLQHSRVFSRVFSDYNMLQNKSSFFVYPEKVFKIMADHSYTAGIKIRFFQYVKYQQNIEITMDLHSSVVKQQF